MSHGMSWDQRYDILFFLIFFGQDFKTGEPSPDGQGVDGGVEFAIKIIAYESLFPSFPSMKHKSGTIAILTVSPHPPQKLEPTTIRSRCPGVTQTRDRGPGHGVTGGDRTAGVARIAGAGSPWSLCSGLTDPGRRSYSRSASRSRSNSRKRGRKKDRSV